MPIQPNGIAPYAPSATILSVIDRARDRGLPPVVTKDVLIRAGVAETLVPRVLQSLQLLELINEDGTWTQNLETLRRCPEAELQQRMGEIVRSVYADVFQYIDPAKDSATQVRDAFRSYTPHGQQDRMVTLFLGLCQRGGIITADSPSKVVAREPRAAAARKPAAPKPAAPAKAKPQQQLTGSLPAPLAGLLQTLPQAWTQEDRDRFLKAFTAMLDYSVPIRAANELKEEEEEAP